MPIYSESNTPEQNLDILANNPYPGRLLVVGFAGDVSVQAYAVEGRSTGSRNRVLVEDGDIIGTEIADFSLDVGDPELTIYDAMRSVGNLHIVSNGNQTDRVVRYYRSGKGFEEAMEATAHEPDAPNFTPRISGFHLWEADDDEPYFGISVIRRNNDGEGSLRSLYTDKELVFDPSEGSVGYCVHTYKGDGSPLPSFDEPPFRIPVEPVASDMAELLWENLDRDNRVAVVAKIISGESAAVDFAIINRHI